MTGNQQSFDSTSKLAERLDIDFALQAAGFGVWELNPDTGLVNLDDRCRDLFGISKTSNFLYEESLHHIHPDDVDPVNRAIQRAMQPDSGGDYKVTYRNIGEDGLTRWIRSVGRSYFDEAGQVIRFAGIAQDVTQHVLDRQALEASQQQTLASFEQAPVALAVLTAPQLTYRMANASYRQLLGRSADQLVGKPIREAVPEMKGQDFIERLEQVIATNTPYEAKETAFEVRRQDKLERLYYDFTYQPWQEDGRTTGVMIVATEVTQQVLSRQKIEASETRFRSLIEEAPVATCLFVGPTLRIAVANNMMIGLWGKDSSIIGQPLETAVPELSGQSFLDILNEVYTTGNVYEARAARAELALDGVLGTYYFDFTYKPLRDESGEVYGIMNMAVNVTEQLLNQQKLGKSEERYRTLSAELEQQVQARIQELKAVNAELAASNHDLTESNALLVRSNDNLQQFAYVASHDLQEPLRKIQSFGDLLKNQYAGALGEGINYLERMQVAARRMSVLIKDLLSYSRIATQRDASGAVSLTYILETLLTDLELTIQETNATVNVDPLPTLQGDPSQLSQLFQNLLSNALKFSRVGVAPRIQVTAHTVAAGDLPASVKPARTAQLYCRIDVADNGIGFNEKYLDRIFQVFQRLHSKGDFAGTGIGLAICEKVATNHGGAVSATSRPGHGSTFSVYLPL